MRRSPNKFNVTAYLAEEGENLLNYPDFYPFEVVIDKMGALVDEMGG